MLSSGCGIWVWCCFSRSFRCWFVGYFGWRSFWLSRSLVFYNLKDIVWWCLLFSHRMSTALQVTFWCFFDVCRCVSSWLCAQVCAAGHGESSHGGVCFPSLVACFSLRSSVGVTYVDWAFWAWGCLGDGCLGGFPAWSLGVSGEFHFYVDLQSLRDSVLAWFTLEVYGWGWPCFG